MSDALPDDAWINSFLSAPPKPLQVALQKRLQTSTVHVNSLAELYKQRAAIEAQYAESLSKLSRSAEQGSLLSKASPDWDKRSIEGRMWESALSELSETSSSHSTLSAIIKTDFEQPLRDLPSKIVSWRRIGDQDASLEKTLKDYEKTSSKLEKASQKSKSGKTDALSNELSQLTSSLSSLSPMVYTTYQRLDEERLRTLKEILVRWGTIRADMSQRDGERAERSVAVLVSLETQDEVLAVGRKLGGSSGDSRSQQSNNAPTLSSTQNTPRSVRRLSNTPSASATDFSPRPTPRQNGSSNTLTSGTPSSFAGGLKSMLGRKSTIGPTTISRNRSGSNAPSTQSGREREGNFSTIGENGENAGPIQNGAPVDEEGFSVAPADRHRNPWEDPDELIPAPAVKTSSTTPATAAGANSMHTDQLASSPSGSSEDLRTSTAPTQPRLNLAMTSAPIEEDEAERQAALNRMQQTLQLQPQAQPTRRGTIARGRRDVRNTMFATSALDSAALSRLSSSPSRSEGGSMLNPVSEPTPTFGSSAPSQSEQPTAPAPIARQSSTSSVGSNNPFDSPGLGGPTSAFAPKSVNGPGLRANMTESMNVIMQGEKIQRIQVNGEVHVTLRDMEGHSLSQGPIHIQLTEFERLEKIAPNPAYLAQVPDKPGEYFLNSEVLASATKSAPSTGTLLFRYQVYIPTGKEASLLPLFMEPAFRSTDGETKLIVNYRRNPACQLSASQLSGLSLVVAFGPGPNITNVQAKPAGGVWSPATRRMTWTIGQDELEKGKLIAKLVSVPGGGALTPLGVQASWAIAGELCSGIGLEVISGGGNEWSFEEVKKVITTGKYLSEPAAV